MRLASHAALLTRKVPSGRLPPSSSCLVLCLCVLLAQHGGPVAHMSVEAGSGGRLAPHITDEHRHTTRRVHLPNPNTQKKTQVCERAYRDQ